MAGWLAGWLRPWCLQSLHILNLLTPYYYSGSLIGQVYIIILNVHAYQAYCNLRLGVGVAECWKHKLAAIML